MTAPFLAGQPGVLAVEVFGGFRHQLHGNHVRVAVAEGLQFGALHPLVEGPERGPGVHLVVHAVLAGASEGEPGRVSEVPPEDQGQLLLGMGLCLVNRGLLALAAQVHLGVFPDLRKALLEEAALKLLAHLLRNVIHAVVVRVERIELVRARRKEDAFLEHLHLGAHLEHVARGRVVRVLNAHLLEEQLRICAHPGLHRALVDGAGEDEVRAHDERRRGGLRRADATPWPMQMGSS